MKIGMATVAHQYESNEQSFLNFSDSVFERFGEFSSHASFIFWNSLHDVS